MPLLPCVAPFVRAPRKNVGTHPRRAIHRRRCLYAGCPATACAHMYRLVRARSASQRRQSTPATLARQRKQAPNVWATDERAAHLMLMADSPEP